jgi:hypothetical protein
LQQKQSFPIHQKNNKPRRDIIEEYQEIRDINGNKQILKFVYLPTHFTIERTISSNGENPRLVVKWEANTIYDLKIEKI